MAGQQVLLSEERMQLNYNSQNSEIIKFCSSPSDIFTPTSWSLNPDPPQKGRSLDIFMKGLLSQKVEGGTAHVTVKLGFIQLLNQEYDLW